jgi:hypothetical protein
MGGSVCARRREGQDGAAVVEFAIVFLLFAMLVWGIITYGVIFAAQQTVTHAAAEAARATVGFDVWDDAEATAESVAAEQLSWLGEQDDPWTGSVILDDCPPPADTQSCVYAEYVYPWADNPIVTPLFRIGIPQVLRGEAVVVWEGF